MSGSSYQLRVNKLLDTSLFSPSPSLRNTMNATTTFQIPEILRRDRQADPAESRRHPLHAAPDLPPRSQLGHQPGADREPTLRGRHGRVCPRLRHQDGQHSDPFLEGNPAESTERDENARKSANTYRNLTKVLQKSYRQPTQILEKSDRSPIGIHKKPTEIR